MELAIRDFEVNGRKYRINRMMADKGSFIRSLLVKQLVKVMESAGESDTPKENVEMTGEQMLSVLFTYLDEDAYKKVQTECLNVVDRYEKVGEEETAIPIMKGGMFAIKEMKYDIDTVTELSMEALKANLAPFFTKNALRKLLGQ